MNFATEILYRHFFSEIESFLHWRRKLLPESLREEDEYEDAPDEGAGAHDEEREWSPDGVKERYLRCDDPPDPATEGAAPHGRAPDLRREELRRVDEDNRKTGRRPELPDEGERHLQETGPLQGRDWHVIDIPAL